MENSTRWKNTSNMLENMYDLTTYPELCNPENRGYHKLLESYISNLDPEITSAGLYYLVDYLLKRDAEDVDDTIKVGAIRYATNRMVIKNNQVEERGKR